VKHAFVVKHENTHVQTHGDVEV